MKKGFTLTELAIVLVIIGLITSIVSYGISLQKKSVGKTLITEMTYYTSAIKLFKDKYSYKPGDLLDAELFFTGNAQDNTIATLGDDLWNSVAERNMAWLQLYQAEMADTNIIFDTAAKVPGENRPASRIDGLGWTLANIITVNPPGAIGATNFTEVVRFGGADGATEFLNTPKVSVNIHMFIDAKIDSPNTPFTGKYIVGEPSCMRDDSGDIKYVLNADDSNLLCTGNLVDN